MSILLECLLDWGMIHHLHRPGALAARQIIKTCKSHCYFIVINQRLHDVSVGRFFQQSSFVSFQIIATIKSD